MDNIQLPNTEIADALSFFVSQGFVAYYDDQKHIFHGGTERIVLGSINIGGYVNPFRIHLMADKWTVQLKLGQIPFDVPQLTLQAASQFVVNFYKPAEPFEDGSITADEAVSKLHNAGFDAVYDANKSNPSHCYINVCYQADCSSGLTISRKGSYYFAAEIFKNPFSKKLLYVGDTLLEAINFLCSNLFDSKAYASINSG